MEKFDSEKLRGILEGLPQDVIEYVRMVAEKSQSKEDFLRMIFVGDCPKCNSRNSVQCDEVIGIDNPTLGLCVDCGFVWCLECGAQLDPDHWPEKEIRCGHWEICDACEWIQPHLGTCQIPPWECGKILKWLNENNLLSYVSEGKCANVCAWCERKIPEDSEVYGLGVKIKKEGQLRGKEGQVISWPLVKLNRVIPATVTSANSWAKRAGNDLMFMTCSKKCADALKNAIKREGAFVDRIIPN